MLYKVAKDSLQEELANLKIHKDSVEILTGKSEIIPIKLVSVRTPALNIIKQEMLAAGGDCAIPASALTCATDREDAILLGNRKHYNILLYKIAKMNYFGLSKIIEELTSMLAIEKPQTVLADGRILDYANLGIMGILNITPDSFYGESRNLGNNNLMSAVEAMLHEGAEILDIGGESTRPGSEAVTAEAEQKRIIPVISEIKKAYPNTIISVDTYRAATAKAAIDAGADIINDISAVEADPEMVDLVASTKVPIILMHMRGTPKDMQTKCEYENVTQEVLVYLLERAALLEEKGVSKDKIILDPGIGFAKDVNQNLELMRNLVSFTGFGYPVLLAASRKSTIGAVLGDLPAEERLEGTLATTAQAVNARVQLVRVHDVKENFRLARMLEAIRG